MHTIYVVFSLLVIGPLVAIAGTSATGTGRVDDTGVLDISACLAKRGFIETATRAAGARDVRLSETLPEKAPGPESPPAIQEAWRSALKSIAGHIYDSKLKYKRHLAKLDRDGFEKVIAGSLRIADVLESSEDYWAMTVGLYIRLVATPVMISRVVVPNESVPSDSASLFESRLTKTNSELLLRLLRKEFPQFGQQLGELRSPLSLGDLYAISRLPDGKTTWPDRRIKSGLLWDVDISKEIRQKPSIEGFVSLLLRYELRHQGLEIVVQLQEALGRIPESRKEIEAASEKVVKAIIEGRELPFSGKKMGPKTAWKVCHSGRVWWRKLRSPPRGSRTKPSPTKPAPKPVE